MLFTELMRKQGLKITAVTVAAVVGPQSIKPAARIKGRSFPLQH